jgi:hypothetical protein
MRTLDLCPVREADRWSRRHRSNGYTFPDVDAPRDQGLAQPSHQLWILFRRDPPGLDHRNFAAEARERIRHLQADGASPEDQQVIGPFFEIE